MTLGYGIVEFLHPLNLILAALLLLVAFRGAPKWCWALIQLTLFWLWGLPIWIIWTGVALWALIIVAPIRRLAISNPIMNAMIRFRLLPQVSPTERIALEAGSVWIEEELFHGVPNFERIKKEGFPTLTAEEQAFINGPVEDVCRMVQDFEVWKNRDLPKEVWDFLKKERFFGMIIPKEFDGLGFSPFAHSEVIAKLGSHSVPLAITVMVPNSLGPAELLLHYGSDEQQRHYLPRLARGEELPCFALTEPGAGSDAGSIQATGVLFRDSEGNVSIRLNWEKRWITLAAVATTVGLAFRLKDPDRLLGSEEDLGITCALIPASTPGIEKGARHDPLGVPFYNCPIRGKDVIIPMSAIIGGRKGAGKGWQMLMESLAAGRGISIPAQSTGGAKLAFRAVGAFASLRKQFGMSIAKFEGVAEVLARITGSAYMLEAARQDICGALNRGAKPPVTTAIAKYYFSEIARRCAIDGMDIVGGAGISLGPRNLIAHPYIAAPIAITVEGANILTRTLIIFGQGLLRAHPHVHKLISAVEKNDRKNFDRIFWQQIGRVCHLSFRNIVLCWTRARLVWVSPAATRHAALKRYYQRLSWVSARLAFWTDLGMGVLGGKLKLKEQITGRFADLLGWSMLAISTLKRFEKDGTPKEDLPLVQWCLEYCLAQCQSAFEGIVRSIRLPGPLGWINDLILAMARLNPMGTAPRDSLNLKLSTIATQYGQQRDRIGSGIYVPQDANTALGRLENAMKLQVQSFEVIRKLRDSQPKKRIKKINREILEQAIQAGVLKANEVELIRQAEAAAWDAIQVDEFTQEQYLDAAKGADYATRRST